MLKPIPGHPHYMACSDGRVLSLYTMAWMRPTLCKSTGYMQVSVCEQGMKRTAYVHRLIALAFVPRGQEATCVNHKDENKTNNEASNLEWVTPAANNSYGTARARAVATAGLDNLRKSAANARSVYSKMHERPVVNLTTGASYRSIKHAAEATGLRRTGIWGACNERQRTCGGCLWRYVEAM